MTDIKKLQEECTHDCMSCGAACGEGKKDAMTLDKTLDAIANIDGEELLKALEALGEEESS